MSSQFQRLCFRSVAAILLVVGISGFAGCAQHIGSSIDVPEIPTPSGAARGRLDVSVTVTHFKDVREMTAADTPSSASRFTEPQGRVGETVADAFGKSLQERGVNIYGGAPTTVWGEVRQWQSKVTTTTTSQIESNASIYVEVLDSSGRPKYSGTFHGSRSSQFPVVSNKDVQQSLAVAMSQAIEQAINDEELISALW